MVMVVPNFRSPNEEKLIYYTPDGVAFNLHEPPLNAVLLYEGDGLPDVIYSTTRGPFQHGNSVVEVRAEPRTLDAEIRRNGCSRNEYWEIRRTLNNILRPNRTDMNNPDPGVLRRILSTGEIRDLDCFVTRAPLYRGRNPDGWDEFSIQETLRFTANNPIFYDPVVRVGSATNFTPTPITDLVFPMVFPFVFGSTIPAVSKSISILYNGTWEEYPKITITGPATDISLTHQTLGTVISFAGFTIPAGTVVTLDLTYAKKTIFDQFGISWIGKISESSDLVSFRLDNAPIVPNSLNIIIVSVVAGNSNTRVDIQYKNRYAGLA